MEREREFFVVRTMAVILSSSSSSSSGEMLSADSLSLIASSFASLKCIWDFSRMLVRRIDALQERVHIDILHHCIGDDSKQALLGYP